MRSIAIRCWHCAVRSITAHFTRYLHEINARNQRRKNYLKLPASSSYFLGNRLSRTHAVAFYFCGSRPLLSLNLFFMLLSVALPILEEFILCLPSWHSALSTA